MELEDAVKKYSEKELIQLSRERWEEDLAPSSMTWGREWDGRGFVRALLQFVEFSSETTLLEIGPGYGRVLKSMLEMEVPFKKYVGVDISQPWVDRLNEEFADSPHIEFVCADADTFSMEENFDVCFSSTTFQFLYPSVETAFKNLAEHLLPEGQFIFDFLWGHDRAHFQDTHMTFVRSYSQSSLRRTLAGLGYGDVRFTEVVHGKSSEGKEIRMGVCAARYKRIAPDKNIYDVPVPDEDLIFLVVGNRRSNEFVYSGEQSVVKVLEAVRRGGGNVKEMKRILEWGCGCGRITRHWLPMGDQYEVYGCDINHQLIEWCQKNLTFAEFLQCDIEPPTPYASDTFDLIYAGSVLTHLDLREHFLWMTEIYRILTRTGLAVLTYHGPHYLFSRRMDPNFWAAVIGEEFFGVGGDGTPGSNQINSFATVGAMEWLFFPFDLVWHGPRQCILGEQSTLVLRKKSAGNSGEILPLFDAFSQNIEIDPKDADWTKEVKKTADSRTTCVVFIRKDGEQTTYTAKVSISDSATGELLGESRFENTCGRRTFYYKGGPIYNPLVVDFAPCPSGEITIEFSLERAEMDAEGAVAFDYVYFF